MDVILELVELVKTHKVDQVELIGQEGPRGQLNKLYDAIKSGEVKSDDDAASFLFDLPPGHANYRKLKQRFKDRLVNTLLFIDTQRASFSDVQKAYYNGYRLWAAARVAFGRGARQTAMDLCQTILRQALRYELTELAMLSSRMLTIHQADMKGSKKGFDYYSKVLQEQLANFQAETLAEGYYNDIIRHFSRSRAAQPELAPKTATYVAALKPYLTTTKTYYFNLMYYTLASMQFEIGKDIRSMLAISEEALTFFKSKEHAPVNTKTAFLKRLVYGARVVEEYDKGLQWAEESLEIAEKGTLVWFTNIKQYILLSFHARKFEKGYQLYQEAVGHTRFSYLTAAQQEMFTIYGAYFYFLDQIGELDNTSRRIKQFRLNRFLNSVPNYSKDKQGLNVTILVIQVLIQISRREFGNVIDRMEPLGTYRARYLKQNSSFRANCFIRLLDALYQADFAPEKAKKKGANAFQKLTSVPFWEVSADDETEIVRYDYLWELILKHIAPPKFLKS